jgi:sugar-specific transcriptional regulator TrmB
MDPKKALLDYGLTEKECDTYLALLQLGQATSAQISKKTGILRQTTYDILDKLIVQGFALKSFENNVTQFNAQKPENLIALIDEKKRKMEQAIPGLLSFISPNQLITNQQFSGIKGIKMIYEEFQTASEIYTIQPEIPEELLKEFFVQNFLTKRIENKIAIFILKASIATTFQKSIITDKTAFREVRLNEKINFPSQHLIIYNQTTVMIDYKNLIAIKFTYAPFTAMMKQYFDLLWETGKIV